uniref:ATP-dependent RNA helicase n=1 Tax=Xenopus tropicalis TaxID=8364 RepID=A0A803JQR4_XENTR
MGDDNLILNITQSPAPNSFQRGNSKFNKPHKHTGRWAKSKSVKRKSQDASDEPSPKRPVPPTSQKRLRNAPDEKPYKKQEVPAGKVLDGKKEENPKGRPAVKTSSLFKNNPEVPDIDRPAVKQLKEKVFSADSFSDLGLHPHLVSTINTVMNMTNTTRILDMGFEKDVTAILNALNSQCQHRQNVLLSATLSPGVARLADISLNDPVSVTIAEDTNREDKHGGKPKEDKKDGDSSCFAMPEKLHQHAVVAPSKLKLVTLAAFILGKWKCAKKPKMIVFFPSCELVEFYHSLLSKVLTMGDSAMGPDDFLRLHGNMEQEERTEVFQQFTHCQAGILLCTDVAARGLDLPQVTWIVQFSAPASAAEYIHRVGRTARLGAQGSSLLILIPSEAAYLQTLAEHKISVSEMKMEDILSNLLMEDFLKIRRAGGKKSEAADPQTVRERATVLQTKFEDYVHASADTALRAKKALQSYIRSYATYPKNLKHIFHIRSLHLGHVAKSFGLRDAPHSLSRQLAGSPSKQSKGKPKRADTHKKRSKQRFSDLLRSEYASGLAPKPKKATKPGTEGSQT